MPDLTSRGPAGLNLLSARDAANCIANGDITSEALVADCLARIEAREPELHAWAYIDKDHALAQARARDAEPSRGPLHGVPVAIKDVIDTADMPTAYGTDFYAGHRPEKDSATVAALRAAGAVILGKAKTTQFASPFPTDTRNPHDLERTPGVSSSGSAAAVADFQVPLANGTQTGGSVIRPASCCGIYGFKAGLNGLDRTGIRHLKPSIDTLGLFARTLDDIALMRAALTGDDPAPLTVPDRAARIVVCRTAQWPNAAPETVDMMERAIAILDKAGAKITESDFPTNYDEVIAAHRVITGSETLQVHADDIRDHFDAFNPWSRQRVEDARSYTEVQVEDAKEVVAKARDALGEMMFRNDAIITPSGPGEAPADLTGIEGASFNSLWTIMYGPCVNLPRFTGPHGMPVGLQVVGRQGMDAETLAWAGWIDAAIAAAG